MHAGVGEDEVCWFAPTFAKASVGRGFLDVTLCKSMPLLNGAPLLRAWQNEVVVHQKIKVDCAWTKTKWGSFS